MNELAFPPIIQGDQAAQPPAALTPVASAAVVTIKDAAIAHLRAKEPELQALAERYRAVAFDVSTVKGLGDAKAARHDLRENGRFMIQRHRDATKDLLNAAKNDVVTEAERLIAIVKPIEDNADQQIKVREEQLAAEKAERDRKEAERKQKHIDGMAMIAGYAAKAQGLPAARIAIGIAYVEAIDTSAEAFEEFAPAAAEAKQKTLTAMRDLLAQAEAAVAEAARQEALRIENERRAAELAEQQRKLDEQAAELKRQQQEMEAAQQRAAQDQRSEMAVSQSAGQHSQESACSTQAGRQDVAALGGIEQMRGTHAEDSEDLAGVAPGPLHQVKPPEGANRDASTGQSHDAAGSESPAGRGTDGASALGVAPVSQYSPAQAPQQVLKAEAATPDATDRGEPVIASPVGGPMGTGEPAAAGPSEGLLIETSSIALREALEFTQYTAAAFACKFPTQPKPSVEWWAGLRERIERLQPLLTRALGE